MARPEFQRGVDVGVFTSESYEFSHDVVTKDRLPGTRENYMYQPAANFIATLKQLKFSFPGMAGSVGTHDVTVQIQTSFTGVIVPLLYAICPSAQALTLEYWRHTVAPTTRYPTTEEKLIASVLDQPWDLSNYLLLQYDWDGDITQTGVTRSVTVGYKLTKVAN